MPRSELDQLAYLDTLSELFGHDRPVVGGMAAELFRDRVVRPADMFVDGEHRGRLYIFRDPVTGKPWIGTDKLYYTVNAGLFHLLARALEVDRKRARQWAALVAKRMQKVDPELQRAIVSRILRKLEEKQPTRKAAAVKVVPREGTPHFPGDSAYDLGDVSFKELSQAEKLLGHSSPATPADVLKRMVEEYRRVKRRRRLARLAALAGLVGVPTAVLTGVMGPAGLLSALPLYVKTRFRIYPLLDRYLNRPMDRLQRQAEKRLDLLQEGVDAIWEGPQAAKLEAAALAIRELQRRAAEKFRQEYERRRKQFARMSKEEMEDYIRRRAPSWAIALRRLQQLELPVKQAADKAKKDEIDRLLEQVKRLYPELEPVHVYRGSSSRFRDMLMAPGDKPWYARIGGRIGRNRLLPISVRARAWLSRLLQRNLRESSYVLDSDSIVLEPEHGWPTLLHELGHALDLRRRLRQGGYKALVKAMNKEGPYPLEDAANRLGEEITYRLARDDKDLRDRLVRYWTDVAESVLSYQEDPASSLERMRRLARDPKFVEEGYRQYLREVAMAPAEEAEEGKQEKAAGSGRHQELRELILEGRLPLIHRHPPPPPIPNGPPQPPEFNGPLPVALPIRKWFERLLVPKRRPTKIPRRKFKLTPDLRNLSPQIMLDKPPPTFQVPLPLEGGK